MALGRPLVAIDLPGPRPLRRAGRGQPRRAEQRRRRRRRDRASWRPTPRAVVGMSLGGLTTIALADQHPDLVRRVVLVDVTPEGGGPGRGRHRRLRQRARELRRLRRAARPHDRVQPHPLGVVAAPRASSTTRSSARTAAGCGATAASPTAPSESPRAGAARRGPVGRARADRGAAHARARHAGRARSSTTRPRPSCSAACPTARVEHVAEAGHSVQGDDPLALAGLLARLRPRRTASWSGGGVAWGGRRARRRSWGRPRTCRRRRGRRTCTRSCRSGRRPSSARRRALAVALEHGGRPRSRASGGVLASGPGVGDAGELLAALPQAAGVGVRPGACLVRPTRVGWPRCSRNASGPQ